jgi:hypothetical protein
VVFVKGRMPQAHEGSGVVMFVKDRVPQAHEGSGAVVVLEATSSSQHP